MRSRDASFVFSDQLADPQWVDGMFCMFHLSVSSLHVVLSKAKRQYRQPRVCLTPVPPRRAPFSKVCSPSEHALLHWPVATILTSFFQDDSCPHVVEAIKDVDGPGTLLAKLLHDPR